VVCPLGEGPGKMKKQDSFYSISGAIQTHNLVKYYMVFITLFLSNKVVCFDDE